MAKKKGSVQASGGARLIASGKKPVTLGLTIEEMDLLDKARGLVPRTAFITAAAMGAAKAAAHAAERGQPFDVRNVEAALKSFGG